MLAMVGTHVSKGTDNIAVASHEELVIARCRKIVLAICAWQSVLLSVKNECSVVKE
jgi:hypothetical protein